MQTPRNPVPGAPRKSAPRPPVRRGAKRVSLQPILIALVAVLVVIGSFMMQYRMFPEGILPASANVPNSDIRTASALKFNEFMSSNKGVFADDRGKFPDWIELVNEGDQPISLNGYMLTDDVGGTKYFEFPDQVLQPGEFVLVFASGRAQNNLGETYHAPFKLSSSEDTVYLTDPTGAVINSVNLPSMERNQVYARRPGGDGFEITSEYTPMMANTHENYLSLTTVQVATDGQVIITEIMASNSLLIPDEDGEYPDWIELYNRGNSAVSLKGYALSDDPNSPKKFVLPDVSIGPGEYKVIYASGKTRLPTDGAPIHANFKISAEREILTLTDSQGRLVSRVMIDALPADVSFVLNEDGSWAQSYAPTPGAPNTVQGAALADQVFIAQKNAPLLISEVVANNNVENKSGNAYDFIEIYNRGGDRIDLSGYGLSDNPKNPRKWQFPSGASIAPGEYMVINATGRNSRAIPKSGNLHTSFSLKNLGHEIVVLSGPDGNVLDRASLPRQYADTPYGRIAGQGGFFYFAQSTPGKANPDSGYEGKVEDVVFSSKGGLVSGVQALQITGAEGAEIRYTLDFSEPGESSPLYAQPFAFDKTTIVRARAYKSGYLPSDVQTVSFLFGISHTMPVVSLVTEPDNLWSDEKGIYVKGPNAYKEFPHGSIGQGANFWMRWEHPANVELFGDDSLYIGQRAGISLHGQYSRAENQKAFVITARNRYGKNRFEAPLFPNRPYTSYQSFVLRGSGQDGKYSRMRDVVQTQLAQGTTVMYQDYRPVIVYLNGEYWGHYNMRERVNKHSIAQREGISNPDEIDLIKGNRGVLNGTFDNYEALLNYAKSHSLKEQEHLDHVLSQIDVDNYFDYVILQMFTGNTDNGNIKFYRDRAPGGKWRWVLYDLDWGFFTLETDTVTRYLNPKGMGVGNYFDNTLIRKLLQNKQMKDQFLTRSGELMATNFTTENVLGIIDRVTAQLEPEMEQHLKRWDVSYKSWQDHVKRLRNYAKKRPKLVLSYIKGYFKLDDSQMRHYFGEAMDIMND